MLEIQTFAQAYKKGWTYVRTILSEPEFLGCIDDQIFLPLVLARERELCCYSVVGENTLLLCKDHQL